MYRQWKQALALTACPRCKGDLRFDDQREGSFVCEPCAAEYPVIDGIIRFIGEPTGLLAQAKLHWESSAHFQYEAKATLYSREYYEEQDQWRSLEVDPFSMREYAFERVRGLTTLDVGCGSGWVIKQSAKHGAFPIGVDFTEKATVSTRDALRTYDLPGLVLQADAQSLPLKPAVVDRAYSIGVLHHIPDTQKGINEVHRVLKPGGTAFISLYARLFFFNPWLFPLAKAALRVLLKAPKVRDGIQYSADYDEFYRMMDGPTNPIGTWYSDEELIALFTKFKINSMSRSHFPLRYLKIGNVGLRSLVPGFVHKFLELRLGMMRNVQLEKP